MNPEQMNPEVHEMGTNQQIRTELQAEIENLEAKLEDPTLRPEQIKEVKQDLELFRQQLKDLK